MENEKILSFDVGIKNLAYCKIEKTGNEFKILKWGIINLVDDRVTCNFKTRKGTDCGKVAICEQKVEDKMLNLCKLHKAKLKPKEIEADEKDIYSIKCNGVENKVCKKMATCKKDDIYFCDVHFKQYAKDIMKGGKQKKISDQNAYKQPIQTLTYKLYQILDKFCDFLDVSRVLIENQPTFKNPTSKTISSLLYGYFVMRGMVEKEITKSNIIAVQFKSPSNKLKINKKKTEEALKEGEKAQDVYAITKELGIEYTKVLIKDDKQNMEILNNAPKQDDLCDSFLQGFHDLFCKQMVPEIYALKLIEANKKIEEIIENKKKKKNK